MLRRSYWIPGSYVPMLSKNRHLFLTLLKNKGSKEERMTKVGRSYWIPGSYAPMLSKNRHSTTPCPWNPIRA
jgi:hypothetical protein